MSFGAFSLLDQAAFGTLRVFDMNGDNAADVVGGLGVLALSSSEQFDVEAIVGGPAGDVLPGRFGGGAAADLTVSERETGAIHTYLDGALGGPVVTAGPPAHRIAARDVDGDGVFDLALQLRDDSGVELWRGSAGGEFSFASGLDAPNSVDVSFIRVEPPRTDLVASYRDRLEFFADNGAGGFGPAEIVSSSIDGPVQIIIAPSGEAEDIVSTFFLDATTDVVLLAYRDGAWAQSGTPADDAFRAAPATGDLNADGIADVVVATFLGEQTLLTAMCRTSAGLAPCGAATLEHNRIDGLAVLPRPDGPLVVYSTPNDGAWVSVVSPVACP